MDFEYIRTLLDVVHKCVGVPNTGNIVNEAYKKLAEINSNNPQPKLAIDKPAEIGRRV